MIRSLIRREDLRIVPAAARWKRGDRSDDAAPLYEKACSLVAIAALILIQNTHAPDETDARAAEPQRTSDRILRDPYVKIFRGPHVPKKLSQITLRDPFNWRQTDNRIGAVATGSKIVDVLAGALTFEWEGLYADHWGDADFHEFGSAIYWRWNRFPWNNYIRTTFAMGMGPSITTKPAPYEPKGGKRSLWLMQMNFEINLYSPSKPDWALLLRIQHRSGIYKLINNVRGGSNFLTIGLRKNFPR